MVRPIFILKLVDRSNPGPVLVGNAELSPYDLVLSKERARPHFVFRDICDLVVPHGLWKSTIVPVCYSMGCYQGNDRFHS